MRKSKPAPRPQRGPHSGRAPVTLQMVAQSAGVSPATVSRILNGTAVVSSDKRSAVEKAITQLGFVPNPVARGLAGGRTFCIGVVTQAIDSPFYGGALRGIEDVLAGAGYSAMFVSGHWQAKHEARCIETLRSRRVDGLIVLTRRSSHPEWIEVSTGLPLADTGRTLDAPGLYSIDFDNVQGARLATEHLIGLGHRRIAFVSGVLRHRDAQQRLSGYKAALREAGIEVDPALILSGDFTEAGGQRAIDDLLDRGVGFSAVFASNDQMAFGAALALYRRGRRVPQDVSLVGFDDLASSVYAIPPLTTVHHPVYELGQLSAQAVLQLLEGRMPALAQPVPRLVVRDSTGPTPKR